MRTASRVLRYEASNVLRGRGAIAWGLFFLGLGEALIRFGGDDGRALLSLVNVVLFVVPLVSLVFGAMYLYGAREFNALLLAQPVRRRDLFIGLWLGVALPLAGCVAAGLALPFAARGFGPAGPAGLVAFLVAAAVLLTFVFVALAFWIALRFDDRARGLGVAILLWLGLAVLWDALILGVVAAFGAWPLERPVLALVLLNPIDLARILLMLRLDVAAMMGYTGALFQAVFGSALGVALAVAALSAWCAAPLFAGARLFARKDY